MDWNISNNRGWAIAVACLALGVVAAYFVGIGSEHMTQSKKIAAVQIKYEQSQAQLATVQTLSELLRANGWAYRAAIALDNRNFGLANDGMAKVSQNLSAVDAQRAGLDQASLSAVMAEAASLKIAVATDLEPQRAQLLKLANDISVLTDAAK